MRTQLHSAQITTLRTLRRHPAARFSMLMRQSRLTSDAFKFHLQKLQKMGYVRKAADGEYSLTPIGKEFANNLHEAKRSVQKQPKPSILLVVPHPKDETLFLFQQRKRQPYYGFWGCLSGPVRWGQRD